MESLFQRAEQLAAQIADAARSTEQYETLKDELDRINDKLSDLGAGEEVVDFLLAVAGQTATLENVTGEVREWLEERHSLGRFKVGL
jgi:ABC-type transporter Mla subunit MlaD